MARLYAVLAGDLVRSSRLSMKQSDGARLCLRRAVAELGKWKRHLVRGEPEFFRGDAWQILLSAPRWSLRAAVFLRATLLSQGYVDTRVAIGLGTVASVPRRRISLARGQAFTLSGHALDKMERYLKMVIALPPEAGVLADWLPLVGQLCDALIGHWTRRQAEIVRVALSVDNPMHAEIAERLHPPVTKQTVTKALAGADWRSLRSAIRQFEETKWSQLW